MSYKVPTEVNLRQLLLGGNKPRIAVFVECNQCIGQGKYPVYSKGGPYGVDQNRLETCRKCYNASGKRLVTVDFDELVSIVRELSL